MVRVLIVQERVLTLDRAPRRIGTPQVLQPLPTRATRQTGARDRTSSALGNAALLEASLPLRHETCRSLLSMVGYHASWCNADDRNSHDDTYRDAHDCDAPVYYPYA